MSRKIQIVMNVPFVGAGNIKDWAQRNDFTLEYTRLYNGEELPDVGEFDMAAVMGGTMNIYETEQYPWLEDEKLWLKKVVEAEIPVIGICLGAQLLADVLGGRVERNEHKEIGAFEICRINTALEDNLLTGLPEKFFAFQWHGDRFILPEGATLLAESQACRYQAFQYKKHVLGLQFHLDYSVESLQTMFEFCSDDLAGTGEYVQTREDIMAAAGYAEDARRYLADILDRLYDCRVKQQ